jgi:kynureninase
MVPTITSRIPALTDYLVNLFNNAATLGAANPPVTIYDGPPTTELDPGLKLYVGWTDPDDPVSEEPGAESTQDWAGLGRFARDEIVTIHCCAEAWSGIDDIKAMRTACAGITAAVEALLQADNSQFGGNVLYPMPGLTNVSTPQNNTSKGSLVRQTFDLIFRCRIGGF